MKNDRDYWLNKWENKEIFFHRKDVNPDVIELFPKLNLAPNSRVFVPLCGKSCDLIWFASARYFVTGVELSQIACEQFFSEQGVTPVKTKLENFIQYEYQNIKLLCGDIFKLTPADIAAPDAVFDSKALIALPPEFRKKYVDHVLSCVGKKAKYFLITLDTPVPVQGPPYPLTKATVEELFNDLSISILKSQRLEKLAEHLITKGYRDVTEIVYLIE